MESNKLTEYAATDCRLIALRKTSSEGLTVCSPGADLPFAVKRVFYIYDVNTDNHHPGHAHYREQQALIAIRGSFDVVVSDGTTEITFHLDRSEEALYIPSGIWCSLSGFTPDAVCLVLSSTTFDNSDYIRDYSHFVALRR